LRRDHDDRGVLVASYPSAHVDLVGPRHAVENHRSTGSQLRSGQGMQCRPSGGSGTQFGVLAGLLIENSDQPLRAKLMTGPATVGSQFVLWEPRHLSAHLRIATSISKPGTSWTRSPVKDASAVIATPTTANARARPSVLSTSREERSR
jgi:hypothetical protein